MRPNLTTPVRKLRKTPVRAIREYALDGQNPGRRRNFTVRDSQAYVEPTMYQMSGAWHFGTEKSKNRVAGIGQAGV